jgi:hypothetical protein
MDCVATDQRALLQADDAGRQAGRRRNLSTWYYAQIVKARVTAIGLYPRGAVKKMQVQADDKSSQHPM